MAKAAENLSFFIFRGKINFSNEPLRNVINVPATNPFIARSISKPKAMQTNNGPTIIPNMVIPNTDLSLPNVFAFIDNS